MWGWLPEADKILGLPFTAFPCPAARTLVLSSLVSAVSPLPRAVPGTWRLSEKRRVRLRLSQLLQQNSLPRGLINKTLFAPVLGGREQKRAGCVGALTNASIPSCPQDLSEPKPLPKASPSNTATPGVGFQPMNLGGLGTHIQSRAVHTKPPTLHSAIE